MRLNWIWLALKALFLGTGDDYSTWSLSLLWLVRIVSFALLLRTYIVPTVLRLFSTRIRVRSISVRSIRGIYCRAGARTWHIERIRWFYHRPSAETASRFLIRIEGVKVDIGKPESQPFKTFSRRKSFRLSNLAPFPVARRIWSIFSALATYLEPTLRPIIRAFFVTILRIVIRIVPPLTQVVEFELDSVVVTFSALSGVSLVFQEATLHTKVVFTQLEHVIFSETRESTSASGVKRKHSRFRSVINWKDKFATSLERTWDRAWGKTQGTASINLKIHRMAGFTRPWPATMLLSLATMDGLPLGSFLNLPGVIEFRGSMHFNPKKGVIEPHSLETSLSLPSLNIGVNDLQILLDKTKEMQGMEQEEPPKSSESDSFASPYSPISPGVSSPTSPSLRSHWRHSLLSPSLLRRKPKPTAIQRLKTKKPLSWISTFKNMDLQISTVQLQYKVAAAPHTAAETYKATASKFAIGIQLSNPTDNPLHRKWLGRQHKFDSQIDADVYGINFSLNQTSMTRTTEDTFSKNLRLVSVDHLDVRMLVTQWPAPYFVGVSYMSGDPNDMLLAAHVTVGNIEIQDRLDVIRRLSTTREVPELSSTHSPVSSDFGPVPRIMIDLEVGSIQARLICADSCESIEPLVLQARSDGIAASVSSDFFTLLERPSNKSSRRDLSADKAQLRANFACFVVLRSTFLQLLPLPQVEEANLLLGTYTPIQAPLSILSLDTVELQGSGSSLGYIGTEPRSYVSLDLPTAVLDLQCSTDALTVELWQLDVVEALKKILSLAKMKKEPGGDSKPILDKLPFGLILSFSIERIVFLVAGPDINPEENLDLSRGVVLRAGVSLKYSALNSQHLWRFHGVQTYTLARHKLYIPELQASEAIAAARASQTTQDLYAFFRLDCWDVFVRDTVATPFEIDDDIYSPLPEDPSFDARGLLHMPHFQMKLSLHGNRMDDAPYGIKDVCEMKARVPYIRSTFHLAHACCLLLAIQTVEHILEPNARPVASRQRVAEVFYKFDVTVGTFQLLCKFPLKQKLCIRADDLSLHSSPKQWDMKWQTCLFWVFNLGPTKLIQSEGRWEELGRLRQWSITSRSNSEGTPTLLLSGDSARLNIPYGFVLADLIQDISITVKAVRQLYRSTSNRRYMPMESPTPEKAKLVPDLRIRIRCLALEAVDDPFESKLGLISRAGFVSANIREQREEAFKLKATTVLSAQSSPSSGVSDVDSGLRFTPKHSVPIEEAHKRLLEVHSVDWIQRYRSFKEVQEDEEISAMQQFGDDYSQTSSVIPNLVPVASSDHVPGLLRATVEGLDLRIASPSFPPSALAEFLYVRGEGLPKDTEFSLLVPFHLGFSVDSLRVGVRDYPLPLIHIPAMQDARQSALDFESDLVIAEEMGTSHSVDWSEFVVLEPHYGIYGASAFSLRVPKTIMPVKTYASPLVRVMTDNVTDFAWGVSYGPATQDLMRVLDGLTTSPRDSSPAMGFWDKLRLSFHWQIKVTFESEVHLHMKGSRDPYHVSDHGAGLALCWRGHPRLEIGFENKEKELVQMTSDTMLIVIPNLQEEHSTATTAQEATSSRPSSHNASSDLPSSENRSRKYRKICAKFSSDVRFGVRFVLERSCGQECQQCTGTALQRSCRYFDFRPHYEVKLGLKERPPEAKSTEDSYNGFRSDFIHMSISLTSMVKDTGRRSFPKFSGVHLTPKTFTHFWSWWGLFDGALSLPIRQGRLYHHGRPPSPKFGHHLATIKYRIAVDQLFISHVYMDESSESWADGVTSFVGMKALISEFHADMHQREQEMAVPGHDPGTTKLIRRKPFYAAEVVMKELDLRAMLATFKEPLKQSVPMEKSHHASRFRPADMMSAEGPLKWIDANDFVETDWVSSGTPIVHFFPTASCPRFTYFKSAGNEFPANPQTYFAHSKFGGEDTHVCFLGKEASVSRIQIELARARIQELRDQILQNRSSERDNAQKPKNAESEDSRSQNPSGPGESHAQKMLTLLESYVSHLQTADVESHTPGADSGQSYYMPSDTVSSSEWAEFDNVYQVHCPKIFMSNSVRDILLQYYYSSRSRRGFEYRMATRAVKFMRDQAIATLASNYKGANPKPKGAAASAQAAANALRRILTGDEDGKVAVEISKDPHPRPGDVDPLSGWSEGVSLRKSHFCLLLKPQVVLRSQSAADAVCVLAGVQAKLQSFAIMDDTNAEDPVSGKVLTRSYTSLTGLQMFSPSALDFSGDGCVPLEVLIDLRCESSDFDRLIPQTDATFHYDKFNRLSLSNNVTSVIRASDNGNDHLQHQTDLVQVHVPRFTVSADDRHFQAISTIVTDLILFSDATHKTRLDKLETMLFSYDFTDLSAAADVVADLQSRLRHVMETERSVEPRLRELGTEGRIETLKIKAHILRLADELNLIFDAIKLAQDKVEDHTDQKSALLLRALSSEISWRMLDDQRDLLAKVSLRQIDYSWLSRQDSSTGNTLGVGDLQAFDGSPAAIWAEIISKHNEPSNHPLVKRGLFLLAHWIVLAPVGGITIYQDFELKFHPMRLQLDTRVGRRIMEYVWPARKHRNKEIEESSGSDQESMTSEQGEEVMALQPPTPSTMDTHGSPHSPRRSLDMGRLRPPLRRLGGSKSFTDLRSATSSGSQAPKVRMTQTTSAPFDEYTRKPSGLSRQVSVKSAVSNRHKPSEDDDAALMRTRSSQKTFIRVRVDSLHLLLSVMKQDSFLCRDAHIRTRELLYRNQTWSFEELVDQFIPSDPGWMGWVKMALQQPLIPVLPVARELITKTQWIASKGKSYLDGQSHPTKLVRSKPIGVGGPSTSNDQRERSRTSSPHHRLRKRSYKGTALPPSAFSSSALTTDTNPMLEPDSRPASAAGLDKGHHNRHGLFGAFLRSNSRPRTSGGTSSSEVSHTNTRLSRARRHSVDQAQLKLASTSPKSEDKG